jgi:hypothetical protein
MDDRDFERLLRDALGRQDEPAPVRVEVADRVMARIAKEGAIPDRLFGLGRTGRWALAASIVGLTLVAASIWLVPALAGAREPVGHLIATFTDTVRKLAIPAASLAATMGRVARAVAASVETTLRPLAPFQPLLRLLLTAVTAVMLGITAYVVGRDVGRTRTRKELA